MEQPSSRSKRADGTLLGWSRGSGCVCSQKMDLQVHKLLFHLFSHVLVDINVRYTKCPSPWGASAPGWPVSSTPYIDLFCPGALCGWMGCANPPVCPAVLSQLHAGSLEVMGFEMRHPASTGRAERGEELWGLAPSHHTLGMGHRGCAGL